MEIWTTLALGAFLFALGYYVNETHRRVKAIKNQLGRLSLTFLKIENDIDHLHRGLLVLADGDAKKAEEIGRLYQKRREVFRFIVEQGPSVPDIMRGLEDPDIDDDPAFWAKDRMRRFGFTDEGVDFADSGK